jgi:hypothetical protein
VDAFVAPVLEKDFQHSRVLLLGRGKNLWRLAGKKDRRVPAVAIDHAANDDHGG